MMSLFTTLLTLVVLAPTNYAGTWTLDKAKSQLPRMMQNLDSQKLVISQDAKTLTNESTSTMGGQAMPTTKFTYNLDGSETTAEMTGRMPGTAKLTAKWMEDGKKLQTSSVRSMNMGGNAMTVTSIDLWDLSADGKTLTIHRTSDTPQGKMESTLVYTKA